MSLARLIRLFLIRILRALLSGATCRNVMLWGGIEVMIGSRLILMLLKCGTSCAHVFYSLHYLLKENMNYITMIDHYFVILITLV